MDKLFFIAVLTGCFIITAPTAAQESVVGESAFTITKPDFSTDGLKKLLTDVTKNAQTTDDLLLNSLLAIPFEKRQYIFPQLHENTGMGKKILSHPEIAVWKGKQPTDIPPNLNAFVKDHLAYLPAKYYVFLDPDYWQEAPAERSDTQTLTDAKMQIKLTPHKGEFYTFPKVENLYQLSEKTKRNYKKTDLKVQDVSRLFQTITALNDYIENQDDPRDVKQKMISIMIRNDQVEKDLADPFLSLVTRLKMIRAAAEVDAFFKQQGWKNAEEFAEKSDRILKAYRVNYLNPVIAVGLNKVRSYPASAPTTPTLENLRMFAKMHEAAPGDVYFVEPYLSEIRKNLKPDYILLLGTPIYID